MGHGSAHQHHAAHGGHDEHAGHTGHGDHTGHDDHSGHVDHTGHAGHDHAGHRAMTHDHHGLPSLEGHGGAHAGHAAPAADPHAGHTHHGHAGHAGHGGGKVTWKSAAQATLHCLTGCAIGEILGLVIGTAFGWHNGATTVAAIILAFFFGYALTMWGIRKSGLGFGQMVKVALAADTVSIVFMEIIDNGMMWVIPGAMDAGLGSGLFWGSLVVALFIAFLVTTPINKWIIGRGKGHAVVHQYHGGH